MSKDLTTTITSYTRSWRRMSRLYAAISIVLKGLLIVASAIVASKGGLGDVIHPLAITALGIVVAIGTALDAWLKPREKWKGFMTDCEKAEDVLMRLNNAPSSDSASIDDLRREFQSILANHREKNVS